VKPVPAALAAISLLASASSSGAMNAPAPVCTTCVKANLEHLAGDALHGRKCGSEDEHAAASYLVSQLKRSGIRGAFERGGYLQPVQLLRRRFAVPPTVELSSGGRTVKLAEGDDMVVSDMPATLEAPLTRLAAGGPLADVPGKVVIYDFAPGAAPPAAVLRAGAAAVIVRAGGVALRRWDELLQRAPGGTEVVAGPPHEAPTGGATIVLKPEVFASLADIGDGAAKLTAAQGEPEARTTYNVIGVIHGRERDADRHAILLSAHYDHLGVRNGVIFHGADDDASGTAAVLEFARILGSGPRPRRTVYFGLFGCEEEGELGSEYFQSHPPEPTSDFAANLEFEMIAVDDPKNPGALMLTGWERSNLGPALKAHGALIGPDPYPQQRFFQRSDNYQLALSGVVAQAVTAWALTPTYHSPTDDLAHVDLAFMDRVIASFVPPIQWLVNSDFQPQWNPGGRP